MGDTGHIGTFGRHRESDGEVVTVASFALLLVASVLLVIGLLQSSMPIVCLALGGNVVAGLALAVSVLRGRSTASPPTQPMPTPGHTGTFANSRIGPPAPPVSKSSDTDSTDDRGSFGASAAAPPPPPPSARSPLEPPAGLQAPGPGLLGRLRRRPPAERESSRPPLTALAEDSRPKSRTSPKTRTSRGEGGSTASRPSSGSTKSVAKARSRSTSVSPEKVADRPKRAAEGKVRVPPGTSASRPRATGKPATRGRAASEKAARTAGPPGARQASRGRGAAKTQARPLKKAARK
jgi:hypothetical protein